jgi:hypothetical protein
MSKRSGLFYLPLLLDIVLSCSSFRFFWTLYCLVLFTPSFGHCIVCSIYHFFWTLYCLLLVTASFGHCIVLLYLPLLLDIVLSCSIYRFFLTLYCLVLVTASFGHCKQCQKEAVNRTRQYNVQKKW